MGASILTGRGQAPAGLLHSLSTCCATSSQEVALTGNHSFPSFANFYSWLILHHNFLEPHSSSKSKTYIV